jgi:hypothetical protein
MAVKEASLRPIIKTLKVYQPKQIEEILKPDEIINFLLDEIKLFKLGGSVTGAAWNLIGLLVNKFPTTLCDYLLEVQDVLFTKLKEQLSTAKDPELVAIEGMLKSFRWNLYECKLDGKQGITIDGSLYDLV